MERRTEHREILNMLLFVGRWSGIWSSVDPPLQPVKIIYTIYGFTAKSFLYVLVVTISADLIDNLSDLLAISDGGAILSGVLAVIAKIIVFQRQTDEISFLIERIYGPIDTMVMAEDGAVMGLLNFHYIIEKYMEYGWAGMGLQLIGSMTISPLLFGGVNASLPIRSMYPFDTTTDRNHWIAMSLQVIGSALSLTTMFALDGLLRGFLRWTSFQMQILNSNFKHCDPKYPRSCRELSVRNVRLMSNFEEKIHCYVLFYPDEITKENDCFIHRFETCIKHHQRIIGIVNDVNRIFGYYIFAEFSSSTFIMCLTGFQILLGNKSKTNVIRFMGYCGAGFTHLATCCFFGQMIANEGNKIADSQWASGWENEIDSSRAGYLLNLSLMRAKQILDIKALGFYSVSMETFLMILKSSYSVFALLTATADEAEE